MSDALRKQLEDRIKKAREVIASKQATIARATLDLEDLERASARLEKERARRLSKASAQKIPRETKTSPVEVPAPAPAAPEKKKSSWGGLVPFGD